jgi:glutamyl/glutaminyl-tRNA synthetase
MAGAGLPLERRRIDSRTSRSTRIAPDESGHVDSGVKAGVLIHPTRLAVTGNPNGPSLYHLLEVLGKEKSLARIERTLKLKFN